MPSLALPGGLPALSIRRFCGTKGSSPTDNVDESCFDTLYAPNDAPRRGRARGTISTDPLSRRPRQGVPLRDVGSALRESGLEASSLTMEITECQWMEDSEENGAVMRELRAMGVRFAVDDFGKGYSSMSYLRRLPVDFLKIDRSFVAGLGENPASTVLVEAMVTMAHTLGLEAVGEGVETADQLEQLERIGCDIVQGYHLARPLLGEAVDLLLAEEPGGLAS